MTLSKEKIEEALEDLLYDLLRGGNQESSIKSIEYNEEKEECVVVMDVFIDGDYVAFSGY